MQASSNAWIGFSACSSNHAMLYWTGRLTYLHTQNYLLLSRSRDTYWPANGKWRILESDRTHSIDGVMTGRTLVDLEKPTVPVRIMNLTDKGRRIKKGASIAVCEPVLSVLSLKGNFDSQRPAAKLPKHLKDHVRQVLAISPKRNKCKCTTS